MIIFCDVTLFFVLLCIVLFDVATPLAGATDLVVLPVGLRSVMVF